MVKYGGELEGLIFLLFIDVDVFTKTINHRALIEKIKKGIQ